MKRILILGLAMLACLAGEATAASVGFTGVFNQNIVGGGTGFLGDVAASGGTPVSFGDVVGGPNFSAYSLDPAGNVGTGELLLGSGGPIFVLGGTSSWIDNGNADNVEFRLDVTTTGGGADNGDLIVAFTGDLISGGNGYSEANLDELLNGAAFFSATGSITYVDNSTGTQNIYGGTANAVPEPGALSALMLLGCGALVRRRRS